MISEFFREQKRYSQKELCVLLDCSSEKVVSIIKKLKEFGVLKSVHASDEQREMSELIEKDIEITDVEVDENELLYVFTFVGVIVVGQRVLKCYPKYILKNKQPEKELKEIIKVLEKFNSKEQIIRMINESSEGSSFNILAVLLFLIQDYFENGIYSNSEMVIESNGTGEILWDKTINDSFAVLSDCRPYYVDLQTKKRIENEYDYFRRLHECVLSKASKELREAGLLDLFGITEIDLSDENMDEFGEDDYILYRINNELNVQFNTRKQLVLKTLYTYISHKGGLYDSECFSMFGTNSFNLVWERVCADILNNQLDSELKELHLPDQVFKKHPKIQKLRELIEKPFWSATGMRADDTLIPDIVTIKDGKFFIFDAKYYNTRLENGKSPACQPGIESVIKQYLYQLAYRDFITDVGITCVENCFLLPIEDQQEKAIDKGYVSLGFLNTLGLADIKIRYISATTAYNCYLTGKDFDISLLRL